MCFADAADLICRLRDLSATPLGMSSPFSNPEVSDFGSSSSSSSSLIQSSDFSRLHRTGSSCASAVVLALLSRLRILDLRASCRLTRCSKSHRLTVSAPSSCCALIQLIVIGVAVLAQLSVTDRTLLNYDALRAGDCVMSCH